MTYSSTGTDNIALQKMPTAVPPFPSDVPVADIATIDFDLLCQGDEAQAVALLHSCQHYGFFYLSHHHVDPQPMFDLAETAYALPLEEKLKYDMGSTGHYYGELCPFTSFECTLVYLDPLYLPPFLSPQSRP